MFDDLNDALRLAISLRDFFAQGSWPDLTSDGKLEVRISMHAGPVYEEFDPLLKKRNFLGGMLIRLPGSSPLFCLGRYLYPKPWPL